MVEKVLEIIGFTEPITDLLTSVLRGARAPEATVERSDMLTIYRDEKTFFAVMAEFCKAQKLRLAHPETTCRRPS